MNEHKFEKHMYHIARHALVYTLLFAAAGLLCADPLYASETLSGNMTDFNYFVGGTWDCALSAPKVSKNNSPLGGQVVYDVEPGNVMHSHFVTGKSSSEDYFGYTPEARVFWHASMDNGGSTYYGLSRDGKTFFGYRWSVLLLHRMRAIIAYDRVSANTFEATFATSEAAKAPKERVTCSRH